MRRLCCGTTRTGCDADGEDRRRRSTAGHLTKVSSYPAWRTLTDQKPCTAPDSGSRLGPLPPAPDQPVAAGRVWTRIGCRTRFPNGTLRGKGDVPRSGVAPACCSWREKGFPATARSPPRKIRRSLLVNKSRSASRRDGLWAGWPRLSPQRRRRFRCPRGALR